MELFGAPKSSITNRSKRETSSKICGLVHGKRDLLSPLEMVLSDSLNMLPCFLAPKDSEGLELNSLFLDGAIHLLRFGCFLNHVGLLYEEFV